MSCPDPELLFLELAEGAGPSLTHARTCSSCSALLEEHRQLEKDLFRLADPLPPPDLIAKVMAKVATAPTPARVEWRAGAFIIACALGLFTLSLLAKHGSIGGAGVWLASALVSARSLALVFGNGVEVVWRTAALPLLACLTVLLATSLFGLKRLLANPGLNEAEVAP